MFGERVRTFRLAAGLTQRQLAKQLGIDPTTITKLEAGVTQPQRPLKEALVRRFGPLLAGGMSPGDPLPSPRSPERT
jgi:transcriptional regulator with XRE-family HTH domain